MAQNVTKYYVLRIIILSLVLASNLDKYFKEKEKLGKKIRMNSRFLDKKRPKLVLK